MNEKKERKNESDFVPIRKAIQLTGVNAEKIRRWAAQNFIQYYISPTGHRHFSKKSLLTIVNNQNIVEEVKKKNIIYGRVSSQKQKNDLDRQVEYLRQHYPSFTVVTDIGSGINWKRKGLLAILEFAMQRNIETLVVTHKDRLSRFAFELIGWIVTSNGGKIIILDENNEESEHKSSEQELAEDLLSIVNVYSCKHMGKRRYSTKKSKDPENTTEEVICEATAQPEQETAE